MTQLMQIPLGKKITNDKRIPHSIGSNRFVQGSVSQLAKMQAYRAYTATHFYVREQCRHFQRG